MEPMPQLKETQMKLLLSRGSVLDAADLLKLNWQIHNYY